MREDQRPKASGPAWIGTGGVALLLGMQALGVDVGAITGRSVNDQVHDLKATISDHGTRLQTLENTANLMSERIDNGRQTQAELKASIQGMALNVAELAKLMVRIETKVDALNSK